MTPAFASPICILFDAPGKKRNSIEIDELLFRIFPSKFEAMDITGLYTNVVSY